MNFNNLKKTDPKLAKLIEAEIKRQQEGLELIASENYVSEAVLEALGTVFTNKYSEGYPGKRYYGGQENTDQIEQIAIDRAKELFGADHANVQPLSGALANTAVYFSWLEPGDKVLGMKLDHGGHLTHGSPVTKLAGIYDFVRYGINDDDIGDIDYNELRDMALKNKPKIILAGYSAYTKDFDYDKIKSIADEVGAIAWADIAHIAGLISAGEMKNPFDSGFQVVSTTTHKTLRGPRGGMILSKGIVSNPLKKVEKTIENLPTLIDRAVFPGLQGGPIMNIIFAKGVAFGEAMQPEFKVYAKQVKANAKKLAEELMKHGFKLITNGTENHMMVVDCVKSFDISGGEMEKALDKVGLNASKSMVPNDTRMPFDPSGLRIGTPAITTRGMKENEMELIAGFIKEAVDNRNDENKLAQIKQSVMNLCKNYPLPGF
jgi:glycine hydroxymethyltransferase